jgi:hypothetical protein
LNTFVVKNHGLITWYELLERAGVPKKSYLPTEIYPDGELTSLIKQASEITFQSVGAILEQFGEFIVPSMLRVYAGSINPEWDLFDILENTEKTMHKAVRFADKRADPPKLVCNRMSGDSVSIRYSSDRKMVELGIGIIKGLAKAKDEKISLFITEVSDGTNIEIRRYKAC